MGAPIALVVLSTAVDRVPALLRNKMSRIGFLLVTLVFIGQFASYTYITPFYKQVSHLDSTTISFLLLAFGATGFLETCSLGGWVTKTISLRLRAPC